MIKPILRLKKWINLNKINWIELSANPNAVEFLKENPEKIDWSYLSLNPNAIEFLKENPDKIDWSYLSLNPNAIEFLKENPEKIDWTELSLNSNAIKLLKKNPEKINWIYLSQNENAIELLTNNQDKIDWSNLCLNPNAIELLRNNKNKIDYNVIRNNENYYEIFPEKREYDENIIRLLYENITINYNNKNVYFNSDNCEDMELMEKNQHKIEWDLLAKNPYIFSYDYDEIKNKFQELGQEIIEKALHPKRMLRLMTEYGEDEIYNIYFDDD
jgi:ribosomal protein L24E